MGKHFALTFQMSALQGAKKSRKPSRIATAGRKMGSVLFGACCLLGVMYLYQVNSFSTKGFEIKALQNKISVLQEQQRELQVQSAQLQSLQRIQASPEVQSMESVTSVSYIRNSAFSQR